MSECYKDVRYLFVLHEGPLLMGDPPIATLWRATRNESRCYVARSDAYTSGARTPNILRIPLQVYANVSDAGT